MNRYSLLEKSTRILCRVLCAISGLSRERLPPTCYPNRAAHVCINGPRRPQTLMTSVLATRPGIQTERDGFRDLPAPHLQRRYRMCSKQSTRLVWAAMLALSALSWIACNKAGNEAVSASSDGGKLPITTRSEEARKEFLQGRDLSERLLAQDSLQHFDKALALDPEFASAELARANNSPTAKEFFEHLRKAAGLVTKTSDGEKLLILANEAAANGVTEIQKQYLDQLVSAYPNDERAHVQVGNFYFG